ncbi:MAG: hypothetical protein JST00_00040 [Deltaproteobacteria bacterium]|nr:hypothetical protein [Deltaproteobacteria bacterium]
MRRSVALGVGLLAFGIVAAGCAGPKPQGVVAAPKVGVQGSAACKVRSFARPLGQPRTGSTVALATIGQRKVALVADEDARAVDVVDLETQKEIARAAVDGSPSQLLVTADGRVLVLLRDRARMQVLEAEGDGKLVTRCDVDTPSEPVGIAITPDDAMVVVTTGWGHSLTAFDSARLSRAFEVNLPREPRAVVIGDDGATAFVSHAMGAQVSAVDLRKPEHTTKKIAMVGVEAGVKSAIRSRKKELAKLKLEKRISDDMIESFEKSLAAQERMGCQGFALAKSTLPSGRILAPQVFVDPGQAEMRPEGYGNGHTSTESPSVAVIDEVSRTAFDTSLTINRGLDWRGDKTARDHRADCLLPRAAAVDPRSRTLLVSCLGIDEVIAYDAASADPQGAERRRWSVGTGPTGIAIDPEAPRAFVWSQFDRALSVLSLAGDDLVDERTTPPAKVKTIAMNPLATPLPADYALGRIVFHAAGDARISKDGRACASCHPDGRDDAITWATPDGPRRSIMLAGRVSGLTRFAWSGGTNNLHDHLHKTFDRLDGTGLKTLELDALVSYVSKMPSPPSRDAATPLDAKAQRGAQIFASKEAECSSCHGGPTLSDGAVHDVKSRTEHDRSATFKTPTLRFVGGTGPYFHDGRYKTLGTLLRDADGKMGHTKHLSESDLDALETYLRTL